MPARGAVYGKPGIAIQAMTSAKRLFSDMPKRGSLCPHMARYHKKTGPEGPVSLTGRYHEGPKTQSAGHNARLFFYGFFREMQQDFVVFGKENTACGISVHMLPAVLSTFEAPIPLSPKPCTPP